MRKSLILKKVSICLLLLLLVVVASFSLTAKANSAPIYWVGSVSGGSVSIDEECPIIVRSEKLTLNINELQVGDYFENGEMIEYSSNVVAEYDFYNPTDYHIDTTLVFPFGAQPGYEYGNYGTPNPLLFERNHSIKVNGSEIEKRLRCSFNEYRSDFNIDEDMSKILNDYKEDEFFYPEQKVTKYELYFKSQEKYFDAYFDIEESLDLEKSKIIGDFFMYQEYGNINVDENNEYLDSSTRTRYAMKNFSEKNVVVDLYIVGEPFEEMPEWKSKKYSNTGTEGELEVQMLNAQEMTFKELVDSYKISDEISEVDWYNAVIDSFSREEEDVCVYGEELLLLYYELMYWYEYDISIEPKSSLINTVCVPIFPAQNNRGYSYEYLLSPASKWAGFGELEIQINTDAYIHSSNLKFKEVEGGYNAKFDSLPYGELKITLRGEYTTNIFDDYFDIGGIIIMLMILGIPGFVTFVGVIIAIVSIIKERNKKRQKEMKEHFNKY